MIYDSNLPAADIEAFQRGARIRMTGTIDEYAGTTEITSYSYTVLGTDTLPAATSIDVVWADRLDYEGTWLVVHGFVDDSYYAGGGQSYNIQTFAGQDVPVRVWESTGIDVSGFSVGDELIVKGVGSMYNDEIQILPALEGDIVEEEEDTTTIPEGETAWLQLAEGVFAPSLGESYEIKFFVPVGYRATLRLLDRKGRDVATLYHDSPPRSMTIPWNGRDETGSYVSPGVYMAYLTAVSETKSLEPKMETLVIGSELK